MSSHRARAAERATPGLLKGWGRAAAAALSAAAAAGALAEAIAFLGWTAGGRILPASAAARGGALVFASFNHVTVTLSASRFSLPSVLQVLDAGGVAVGPPGRGTAPTTTVSVGVLLTAVAGTGLAAWLLWRGGRRLAAAGGDGPWWARTLNAAKVSLPYALICCLAAWAGRLAVPLPANPVTRGPLLFEAGVAAAGIWGLGIGLVAGLGGGLAEAGPRSVRAAVAGGWRGFWLALALSFAGLLAVAAVHHDAVAAYWHAAFSGGGRRGIASVGGTVLVLPNLSAWTVFPAMGGCLRGWAGSHSACLLSWTRVPRSEAGHAGPAGFSAPDPAYLLFVLVPLIATIAGGALAAARARAGSFGRAAFCGAGAGVAFAAFALVAAVLSRLVLDVSVSNPLVGALGSAGIAPNVVSGTLLALAWGVGGGTLGGLLHGPASARRRGGPVEPSGEEEVSAGSPLEAP